ncbi:hypothetical protein BRLA_c013950 [Brevibacillus laterosporus LMG 15441]|uniref:Uncharacterized protein n=1 Tax=Brevibacillus laterosporus LMG 15441 TaxID=1042163 RepID=A0A075R1K1_BRELA|nr:hypothetical protein BRLA_c013950 [Brevibacillus laterosporus LMG 15441]ERM17951.1 hypothetical protein P615_18925 [Brevibacillus laterosporus PE36]
MLTLTLFLYGMGILLKLESIHAKIIFDCLGYGSDRQV